MTNAIHNKGIVEYKRTECVTLENISLIQSESERHSVRTGKHSLCVPFPQKSLLSSSFNSVCKVGESGNDGWDEIFQI